jgi:hypothetical protein
MNSGTSPSLTGRHLGRDSPHGGGTGRRPRPLPLRPGIKQGRDIWLRFFGRDSRILVRRSRGGPGGPPRRVGAPPMRIGRSSVIPGGSSPPRGMPTRQGRSPQERTRRKRSTILGTLVSSIPPPGSARQEWSREERTPKGTGTMGTAHTDCYPEGAAG